MFSVVFILFFFKSATLTPAYLLRTLIIIMMVYKIARAITNENRPCIVTWTWTLWLSTLLYTPTVIWPFCPSKIEWRMTIKFSLMLWIWRAMSRNCSTICKKVSKLICATWRHIKMHWWQVCKYHAQFFPSNSNYLIDKDLKREKIICSLS